MSSFVPAIGQINYWAVLTAGLASFFIGGLWYSPVLFEDTWMRYNGYGKEDAAQIQAALGALGFAAVLFTYLLAALGFALLVTLLDIETPGGGLALGLVIWLAFVATSGLAVNLFSVRPIGAWLVDVGFQLTFLLLNGLILSLWR